MPRNTAIVKELNGKTKVPHYEQQFEFTCGPACLMMIFKHFDKRFVMDTRNETDIWRESSLSPLPPTSRYGLAFSALKRGYKVENLSNVKGIEYVRKTPRSLTGRRAGEFMEKFMMELMAAQFEERKIRSLEMGLVEKYIKKLSTEPIEDVHERKGLSIMLTSAKFFDDQDWAHWVVVTGTDKEHVYINDPASALNKGRRVFSRKEFEKVNGYYGDQVLISVFPKN